jgi:PPE-PPW subfamily C-terminal region
MRVKVWAGRRRSSGWRRRWPSDRGAGTLGFAGTASKEATETAGLTTLAGDEFAGHPRMPMLPSTWDPGHAGERGDGGEQG